MFYIALPTVYAGPLSLLILSFSSLKSIWLLDIMEPRDLSFRSLLDLFCWKEVSDLPKMVLTIPPIWWRSDMEKLVNDISE
jgi:hypothetical protein